MYQNRNKSKKEEIPSWIKDTKGIKGWYNRTFKSKKESFRSSKSTNSYNSLSYSGSYSRNILLLTVIPMVLVVVLAILAILGLADDIGMGLQNIAVDGLNSIEFLYLVSNMIENWFEPMDDGLVFLLGIPLLALIIITFVLDVVLLILYSLAWIILFIISIIISIVFVYVLCPGIVILEIVMVVKSYKEQCSFTNKFWSIVALFVTLLSAIIFYIGFSTM